MNDSSAQITAPAATTHPEGPLPLSQLLAHIVEHHGGERLTLSHLAALLRDRAWGGLLLIFAAINVLPLPPGATAITGIPLLILTAQMAAGRGRDEPLAFCASLQRAVDSRRRFKNSARPLGLDL